MIRVREKSKCTGCSTCALSCPKNCIKMLRDDEGFLYPSVNEAMCVNCGICEDTCPVIRPDANEKTIDNIKAYAAYTKNEDIRKLSSSGGIFTELATAVINSGGVVFGAAFDSDFCVKHISVETVDELEKLRSSKYVQSQIGDTYKEAEKFLEQERCVLFSGTPCQIAGLYKYLKKEYRNLYTQDIICHGVPSPLVWEKYKAEAAKDKLTGVSFRDKRDSWETYSLTMTFDNGEEISQKARNNTYIKSFLSNICLRPSCYECSFKQIARQSDITLADFWGVDEIIPEMYDNKGTSLVIINSSKGDALFGKIKENIEMRSVDISQGIKHNQSMVKSSTPHPNRQKFMKEIKKNDETFSHTFKKHIRVSLTKRIINKITRTIGK